MTMNVVPVDLGPRSYEVRIGTGLVAGAAGHVGPLLARKRVTVVTDDTVAAIHLLDLAASFDAAGITMSALALPPGEQTKGWQQFARCVEWLLEHHVERRDVHFMAALLQTPCSRFKFCNIAPVQNHRCTGFGQPACNCQTDTLAGAGNERDTAFKRKQIFCHQCTQNSNWTFMADVRSFAFAKAAKVSLKANLWVISGLTSINPLRIRLTAVANSV